MALLKAEGPAAVAGASVLSGWRGALDGEQTAACAELVGLWWGSQATAGGIVVVADCALAVCGVRDKLTPAPITILRLCHAHILQCVRHGDALLLMPIWRVRHSWRSSARMW